MSKVVEIKNISKMYRLGTMDKRHDTLMETISNAFKSPFQRFKRLSGSGYSDDETTLWALKDVTFDINDGDVVGIVGRNGAGKSTLLKILSRITDPTEGEIRIKGRVASLLEVGTGFHPDLSGRENIYLNGAILGMTQSEIRSKFDEIVDFSEIEKFLDTPVKHYSSGMYIRLAFSVAAHLDPEILVVDEVLAVGDMMFQKKCLGKMENVSKSGRTVLFVSHNMAAVRSLCTRGALLDNGRCVMTGLSAEVVDQYMMLNSGGESGVSLRQRRRNRPGLPAEMMITDVCIENPKTGCIGDAETLDEIIIKISYELLGDVKYFSAEIRFLDLLGTGMVYNSSAPMGNTVFTPKAGEKCGQIVCKVLRIPLALGEYSLEVGLGIPGVKYFDNVEDACRLRIVASDPMHTGYVYRKELAIFHMDCEWSKMVEV